jgi:hypothetical protein
MGRLRMAVALASLSAIDGSCWAYDGLTSELAHVAAGAAVAAAGTAVADRFEVEHPAWAGFAASSLMGLTAEWIQVKSSASSSRRSAWLDAGSNALGAALGAWATDRYLLRPVITRDAAGRTHARIVLVTSF